ncbi:MAG: hypothetical protein IJX54_01860 [Oscillospiraceae bacterium]|nr:hypothetical protein [Oscillospiraceae bacterium]
MTYYDYFWPDNNIESIFIEYDKAILTVFNDELRKRVKIVCSGFAGITNLCIWDDMTIFSTDLRPANQKDTFVKKIYSAYDKNFNYGGRALNDGLLALSIELSNHFVFSIYCLKVEVEEFYQ